MQYSKREIPLNTANLLVFLVIFILAAYTAHGTISSPSSVTFNGNITANYDNDGNFSVNWSAVADASIYYIYNSTDGSSYGQNFTNTSATGYGVFGATNGQNFTFIVQAVNATNSSDTANTTTTWIVVDMENATIVLNSPLDNNITNSSTAIFNFIATDGLSPTTNCSLNLDGSINATNSSILNNTASEFTVSNITSGTHLWNITCTDLAQNTNTSETRSILVNLEPPSITLNSPSSGTWKDPDQNVTFNYTPGDDLGLKNCSLYITNASNENFAYNQSNSSSLINGSSINSFEINLSTAGESNYTWNVFCEDIGNRTAWASSNISFFVGKRADLRISQIKVVNSSNNIAPSNPLANGNITINVTVENNGTSTATQPINISFYWDGVLANISSITNSIASGDSVNVTFNILSANTSTSKPYVARAVVDAENSIFETNNSNNELLKIILTGLNVSITNITPQKPVSGQQMIINLSVKYSNGSAVIGLAKENFSQIFDVYSNTGQTTAKTITTSSFGSNSAGDYWFNITAAAKNASNRIDAGNHTLRIFVFDNSTGQYYDSAWVLNDAINGTVKYYELQAPNFETLFSGVDSIDLRYSNNDEFYIQIKNNGTVNISNISIIVTANLSNSLTKNSVNYSTSVSCNHTANLSVSNTFTTLSGCTLKFKTTTVGHYLLTITGGGFDPSNAVFNSTSTTQVITVTNSTPTTTSSSTNSGSGSNSPTLTYTYLLNITNHSKFVSLEQGMKKNLSFSIKNVGNGTVNNITLTLTLPATAIWTNWYNATNISKLHPKNTETINATIIIPESATVGSIYKITAKVEGAETGSSNTTTFILEIIPGEETKKTINLSLSGLESSILEMNDTLKKLLKRGENINLTVASKKISEVNRLISEARQAILNGDYLTAYNAKKEIETLLMQIQQIVDSESEVVEKREKTERNIFVTAFIILAIAGLLYYMWLPEEGYRPGKGYVFKTKNGSVLGTFMEKINELVKYMSNRAGQPKMQFSKNNKFVSKKNISNHYKKEATSKKLKKMAQNVAEQIKEHGKTKGKPVYNFHKKQRWSHD